MEEEIQGSNPLDSATDNFGSAENFFDALEAEVNSAITEPEKTDNREHDLQDHGRFSLRPISAYKIHCL